MGHKLLSRILPGTDKDARTVARWRPSLLTRSDIQADRDELIGMFMD